MAVHLYTWDVISHDADNITSDHAHHVLCKFRRTASVSQQSLDLTDGRRFNWWGYLAGHYRGRDIVGHGVTKFELRFLQPDDPKTKQRPLDFIVHRMGMKDPFTHVRLHPHNYACECTLGRPSPKEAVPVYGYLREWVGVSIPAIADGVPSPVGLNWKLGRNSASDFICQLNILCTDWILDLTDERLFLWRRYLRSSRLFQVGASKLLQGAAGPRGEGGRWVDLEPRASP